MALRPFVVCQIFAGLCLVGLGCSDDPPPAGGFVDGAVPAICDDDMQCEDGFECRGGLCREVEPQLDAGLPPGDRRLEVCTPDGCDEPLTINFGGSRIGDITEQTVILRSVGELPVTVRDIAILEEDSEFTVDPSGDVATTLESGEELVLRVRHTALDGTADSDPPPDQQ